MKILNTQSALFRDLSTAKFCHIFKQNLHVLVFDHQEVADFLQNAILIIKFLENKRKYVFWVKNSILWMVDLWQRAYKILTKRNFKVFGNNRKIQNFSENVSKFGEVIQKHNFLLNVFFVIVEGKTSR